MMKPEVAVIAPDNPIEAPAPNKSSRTNLAPLAQQQVEWLPLRRL